MDYKYKNGDRVTFSLFKNTVTGLIRGIAVDDMSPLGVLWIVELDTQLSNYPYPCIAVFDRYINS